MADADFQSPLARRDDVGQRERTSNNTEYGSFVEALNAGVDIFNSATFSQKPEGVVLRRWKSSGTYPVLAD